MKSIFKKAFISSIPVLTGYIVLGFGFGIMLSAKGYGAEIAFIMSLLIYAGSMQYIAVGLISSGASLITIALTTLTVNARHLFYGISMLDKYKNTGIAKPYLIFALTDETYSLLCSENEVDKCDKKKYYFAVSALNHSYWIIGSVLGAAVGSAAKFNTEGIDFVLTALFITIFLEQWLTSKNHTPALIGVIASMVCLLIFGAESFLIPSMLVIALLLCIIKEVPEND